MNRHHLATLVVVAAFGVPADAAVTFRYFKQSSAPICISSSTPGAPCPGTNPVYGVLITGLSDSPTAAQVRYRVDWTDGEGVYTTVQTVRIQRGVDLGCWVDGQLCNAPAMWFFADRRDFEVMSIVADEIQPEAVVNLGCLMVDSKGQISGKIHACGPSREGHVIKQESSVPLIIKHENFPGLGHNVVIHGHTVVK